MKLLLASTAAAVAFAIAPAYAQQPPTAPETVQGNVTVQGLEPPKVGEQPATEHPAPVIVATAETTQPPQPKTNVTVDTQVSETPTTTIETKTEIITPVSNRPALDPENPIAPEVKAIVSAKKNYTTADIVKAQHEAMLNTPVSQPTSIITTTTTTPKPGR